MRGWAASTTGSSYNFDDWSGFTDTSFPDQEYPEYTVRIQSAFASCAAPCDSAGAAVTHSLDSTVRKVEVTVTWQGGALRTTTLVSDPPRRLRSEDPVEVEVLGATSLSRGASTKLTAKVYDEQDRVIPDVTVRWYVLPSTGVGSIPDPQAPTCEFIHASSTVTGATQYVDGQCKVVARVVYRGQEGVGESDVLTLTL